MRLAVFTSQFPAKVNTFFARDVRSLLAAGVEVDVFPIYPLDASLWQWVPAVLSETIFPHERVHHATLAECLPTWRPWPIGRNARFLKDAAAVTCSAIRFGMIPVVKSLYVMPLAWAWARRYDGQYDHILSYWGNYAATCAFMANRLQPNPVPFSMFLHAGTDLYRDQVYLRAKLLNAANIFVVCNFNREFVRKLYPDSFAAIAHKIHLHHLGLDLEAFPYSPDGRLPNRLLAVGSFSKAKGFDYLLGAIHELSRRGIRPELELVGDGRESGSLKRLAAELGIAQQVTFSGWQTFERVRAAMQRATVFVHPSIGLGDAVPTVIKEATALGLPVVGTRVAGIPELLDDGRCGCLVPPQDVQALANAIGQLLADEPLRRQYSQAARQHAESMLNLWVNGRGLARLLGMPAVSERSHATRLALI
jgi:colanic acid/amylovoran biosynthesis glycosyltransferase